ncbi:hypothetical protein [Staphylococcus massiliensis]|uniref:Uncharacterized protein n=1 Tax=Staphylococcus massiliensis S46 TaxID=1229783 RepID=K9AUX1_9STAP|nr:hypothetical protein [Staphylococcus massiliensis]EKU46352.1 hypothetical protein C273_09574 [Staphylococcus massiliensis S46]MCG3398667.1 hypothetical protein [Staphylococcus massiliensis]MCG3401229.1 hypothetical protein [Staphylococcus massiliensis]MCG3412594.1 hypothetical protein [Staphylococcus massiliensis]POA01035.1 hypothetical protein CD133_02780 [Staphylococcus massiliensis CCUG 55927]
MTQTDQSAIQLIEEMIRRAPNDFKFHGDIATNLFLYDELKYNGLIEICINRDRISKIIKLIPNKYDIRFIKNHEYIDQSKVDYNLISGLDIFDDGKQILSIIIYDVDNNDWIYRLDRDIRMPEQNIYYHSLKWNVDYIKPEIVLMYELNQPFKLIKHKNYRNLIDNLSYFQFVTLKLVVGEKIIQDVVDQHKRNHT